MSFTISSYLIVHIKLYGFFFYNTATTEIYTLSLHDALPISPVEADAGLDRGRGPAARTVPRDAVERTARVAQSVRPAPRRVRDRKSTRLNSSHGYISYAVFCLKKKKTLIHAMRRSGPIAAHP